MASIPPIGLLLISPSVYKISLLEDFGTHFPKTGSKGKLEGLLSIKL